VVPFGIDGVAGVRATDISSAGPTVNVTLPVTPAEAVIVVVPCVRAVARPPDAIVATLGSDDAQDTALVTSSVDPSE